MGTAKIASKNNPEGRSQAKKKFYDGKEIKPVKLIQNTRAFLGAEYVDTGEVVMNLNGKVLTWREANKA